MSRSLLLGALIALSLAACGGGSAGGGGDSPDASGPTGPGPCGSANPPASCGKTCSVDTDCDVGLHCASGACTAVCTAGGTQCGSNEYCDRNGRCQDRGADLPDANCPDVTVNTTVQTPSVEFVLDRSGSMRGTFGTSTRLQALKDALISQSGVVTALQDKVIFGAIMYTTDGLTCPDLDQVPRALNNLKTISDLLTPAVPGGNTPTSAGIDAAVADFAANPPPVDSTPVIVLATDGEPNGCSRDDPNGRLNSRNAVAAAFRAGIRTIVLSVGSDTAASHLQELANLGAGRAVDATPGTPFFVADDPAELSEQLKTIVRNIRSCDLSLDTELDMAAAEQGTITLGTQTLTFGTDWELADAKTIRLKGAACNTLLTTDAQVSAVFPCGTVPEVD